MIKKFLLFFVLTAFIFINNVKAEETKDLMIFAAASLTNVLSEVRDNFVKDNKIPVKISFASSSSLAKQIAEGAPADIYLSANIKWVDYLEEKKLLKEDTRINLLGNKLALVAPKNSEISIKIDRRFPLSDILGKEKLSLAEVSAVPAGIYAKQALENLDVWDSVKDKIAQSDNVRSALMLVSKGEAPLGIVYVTDAFADKNVKIVDIFSSDLYKPIIYPAAVIADSINENTKIFMSYLRTEKAKTVFEKHGFSVLK